MITLLASLTVITILAIAWWSGIRPSWQWLGSYHNLRVFGDKEAEERFVEETVRRMEQDPRAVEVIYAQSQHHDTNPALVLAYIALISSLALAAHEIQETIELDNWPNMILALSLALSAPLAFIGVVIGMIVMFRTNTHSNLYGKAIDRYCELLHLPKRPR